MQTVEEIHSRIRALLPVDAIKVCYHDNADLCLCRKPKPGMLLEAAAAFGIDLTASYMVGDRMTDVEAGLGAGCRTILLGRDAADLLEASELILSESQT
jgi:D-glycero-D-manno-heptose 1,7-bisphosphate phosphatase